MADIQTIFGRYNDGSKQRLDLTYDYETCAIRSFRDITKFLGSAAIIDLGANIGVYSVYAGALPLVRAVHAFEPAPASFEALTQNVALQADPSKFHCHNVAASDKEGQVEFNMISPMSGANAIVASGATATGRKISVATRTVDSMVKISGQRLSIKIDVEGHEEFTLAGAIGLLSDNDCYLQMECLDKNKLLVIEEALAQIGMKKIFRLRDDYIFISQSLMEHAAAILDILFEHLSVDLADLLLLRTKKRVGTSAIMTLAREVAYQRDPVLP
jgi:FkbM family methyltransferase